jgi:hypothetical protein
MKYFIITVAVSLMAASAYAGVMPEELIEPTKLSIAAGDTTSILDSSTTTSPLDQLIRFVIMALIVIL